ncbi:MAG: phytanoyl-CoA dioxygenase family protein [Caulobacteraceae bacterium]|nr:phytanoyl-CoA dioxygenase family protein [Caulobacteraceae bacterium]
MKPSPASWLLTPLHVAALATGAKSFRDNPIIGSPSLNRMGLHVARMKLAAAMADHRRRRLAGLVCPAEAEAFARDGFILKPNYLPPDVFAALRREALDLRAPARQMAQGDAITRRIALDRAAVRDLPQLRRLIDDQDWLGRIRYVGASRLAPLTYIQTIFSQVRKSPPDPQTELHADTFHSSVKAWLFLTDVGEDDGAFCYVPGSHRLTPARLDWERRTSITARDNPIFQAARGSPRIKAHELTSLGLPDPKLFAVSANTLVVADTLGFHARGLSARPTVRVEIWAYGRRNPFLPWTGLDPMSAPILRDRPVRAIWAGLALTEAAGLKASPWRDAGVIAAAEPAASEIAP